MKKTRIIKVLQSMIYILPAVLCFSYFPVISLGVAETMNLELSLPLIWLAVFDVMSVIAVFKFKKTKVIAGKWWYYLFLFFATLSVFWSENKLRGALILGVMWAVIIAIMAFAIMKREIFDTRFKKNFWKWFFGASFLACAWCWVQCLLDIFGVTRDYTLMCLGCTYQSFGFPHPNGFAIEPQFMGNLLLAPVIASAYAFLMKKANNKKMLLYFLIFASTLFLTFSRGAIYAFVVAMVFLTAFVIMREKKIRKMIVGKMAIVWGAIILAFLFTLNAQGIMTQISPTNDTYLDGVARAVEQLSLGTINIRGTKVKENAEEISTPVIDADDEASFDGYVPESTDVRVKLTNVALEEKKKKKKNMLVGVGVGGAGQALYNDGLIDSPKEIVQNQYASLLLETGLVGVIMLAALVFGFLKWCRKTQNAGMVLTLALAYVISLCFFSGLPNALHIYLLLPLFCYNWNYEKSA